ncbi:hypothetical protein HPP92_022288 [Vanilla planifolia]|uniref:Uncharacterized protein n=1 Tax=Vanilla planifolia TaxID=51239 RepID=A0A835PNA1_VANPL|nr:hypothetical protein HPP92_022288 [Vanilla planifolia]
MQTQQTTSILSGFFGVVEYSLQYGIKDNGNEDFVLFFEAVEAGYGECLLPSCFFLRVALKLVDLKSY